MTERGTQRPVVLVADDSPTVRAVVRLELEAAGYEVVEAEHGQDALDVAGKEHLDAILLDVEMPVLDGLETIAALKADPATADVPVVFLSNRDSGPDVVGALRLGAHDYLRKPPEPAELQARVAAAVEVRGLRAQLHERTAELDRMSRTDHLTGLANRRHLDAALQAAVTSTREHAFPLTVLLLDVDHFKSVNDRLGHEGGDQALREVATRLRDRVRAEDLLGRWGGEELLVLAPQTGLAGAGVLCERLRSAVRETPVVTAGGALTVTVSVGAAVVTVPGAAVDEVLRTADERLYAAKAAGRDCCLVAPVS